MGCFVADQPANRNYAYETQQTLEAQMRLAPQLYASESHYQPLYAQLATKDLATLMNGADGQQGLLDLYQQSIMPAMSRAGANASTMQRQSDINDVLNLGPQSTQAIRAANPYAAGLMDTLNNQAQVQGSQLSPDQMRMVNQSVRGGQAARGMGYGPSDVYGEALGASQFGEQLRQQRQGFAQQMVGANQAFYGDPFQQILGRPGQASQGAAAMLGQGNAMHAQAGPSLFNPESAYAGNIMGGNQAYSAMFADPSLSDKLGTFTNVSTLGLLGKGGSY